MRAIIPWFGGGGGGIPDLGRSRRTGWDKELLALELQELMDADIEFDVGIIRILNR
jgi:hypothetical protein